MRTRRFLHRVSQNARPWFYNVDEVTKVVLRPTQAVWCFVERHNPATVIAVAVVLAIILVELELILRNERNPDNLDHFWGFYDPYLTTIPNVPDSIYFMIVFPACAGQNIGAGEDLIGHLFYQGWFEAQVNNYLVIHGKIIQIPQSVLLVSRAIEPVAQNTAVSRVVQSEPIFADPHGAHNVSSMKQYENLIFIWIGVDRAVPKKSEEPL